MQTLNKTLYNVVADIDWKEVIIDLDSHSKKLYHYFFHECDKRGIKVNNRLRQLPHFSEL